MSPGVIEGLEVVDVEEQERQLRSGLQRLSGCIAERCIEGLAVGDSRQRIRHRLPAQPLEPIAQLPNGLRGRRELVIEQLHLLVDRRGLLEQTLDERRHHVGSRIRLDAAADLGQRGVVPAGALAGVAEVRDQLGERLLHASHARAQLVLLVAEREEALVELVVRALGERLPVRDQDVDGAPELGRLAGMIGVPHAKIRGHGADRELLHALERGVGVFASLFQALVAQIHFYAPHFVRYGSPPSARSDASAT